MAGDFTKVYKTFFTSSIRREDAETRIVFLGMLTLCDSTGLVEASIDFIAAFVNVDLEKTRQAIAALMQPDPDSTSQEEEGRRIVREGANRWRMVTFRKYWDLRKEEERREYLREAKQRSREKKKGAGGDGEPSEDVDQVETSTEVNKGQHSSLSLSPSPFSLTMQNGVEGSGEKGKKLSAQQARVKKIEDKYREYGSKAPAPALIAKWLSEFGEEIMIPTLDDLGLRGHLDKEQSYIFGAFRSRKREATSGDNGSDGRGAQKETSRGARKSGGAFKDYE